MTPRRSWIVHHTFDQDNEDIPGGHIWIDSAVIQLRKAGEFVKKNDLLCRWRQPTFATYYPDFNPDFIRSLQFQPWTAFSIPRKTSVADDHPMANAFNPPSRRRISKSEWFTYYFFRDEMDLTKFVMVWRCGS